MWVCIYIIFPFTEEEKQIRQNENTEKLFAIIQSTTRNAFCCFTNRKSYQTGPYVHVQWK
jgi:hypothetical protein